MKKEIKQQASKTKIALQRWTVTAISVVVLLAQLVVGIDIVFGTNIPRVGVYWSSAIILAAAITGFVASIHKNHKK